jgi:hypothetical protein
MRKADHTDEDYAKIVSDALTGIINGVTQAREKIKDEGVLIAYREPPVEVHFEIQFSPGIPPITFTIPVKIPDYRNTAIEHEEGGSNIEAKISYGDHRKIRRETKNPQENQPGNKWNK